MKCPRECRQLWGGVDSEVTNVDMVGVVLDTVSTVLGWCARPSRGCRHDV